MKDRRTERHKVIKTDIKIDKRTQGKKDRRKKQVDCRKKDRLILKLPATGFVQLDRKTKGQKGRKTEGQT